MINRNLVQKQMLKFSGLSPNLFLKANMLPSQMGLMLRRIAVMSDDSERIQRFCVDSWSASSS